MQQLSPSGHQAVEAAARRHGFSPQAALGLLESLCRGQGRMAQFNHPEFSGTGQWMRGGMTMVSDMFNQPLKARVAGLCDELARLLDSPPGLFLPPAPGPDAHAGDDDGGWWGPGLRAPDSTGAQGGLRYAYFAQARRLAIERQGRVTVHDTLDHRIGGFSQQQSHGSTVQFTSQHGPVDVARLPVVSAVPAGPATPAAPAEGMAPQSAAAPASEAPPDRPPEAPAAPPPPPAGPGLAHGADAVAMIEKLADLHSRGLLTAQEFSAKKAELLARL